MSGWAVGGITLLDGPYMLGAGVAKTAARAAEWRKIGAIVCGSSTVNKSDGNSGKLFWPPTFEEFTRVGFGLNSFGMPNLGFTTTSNQLAQQSSEQPVIASLAGFSVQDYIDGIIMFQEIAAIAAIELNFGCPNSIHGEIMSFNSVDLEHLFRSLSGTDSKKPIWVKFSPYSNPAELKRIAELVNKYSAYIQAVVTCNTFPKAYAGIGKITPFGGLAGLSGPALKPIALGQVNQFRLHLESHIDVIGVGGITTGDDIVEFLDAGAQAVQIVSLAYWLGGPAQFASHLLDAATGSRFIELLNSRT